MLRSASRTLVAALWFAGCCPGASATDAAPSPDPAPRMTAVQPEPSADRAASAGSAPTVLPGLSIVEGHGGVVDNTMLIVCGEVKNTSGHTVAGVRVAVRLFDSQGKELSVTSILSEVAKDIGQPPVEAVGTDRQIVPNGESAPFCYYRSVEKIHGTVASHKLSIHAAGIFDKAPAVRLTTFKSTWDPTGSWDVMARLENAGPGDCRSPALALAVYDAAGKVVRVQEANSEAYFQRMLAPGQSTDIEVRAVGAEEIGTRVIGWADCSPDEF